MTQILWNETVPSGTSIVAQAPAFYRSEMSSIAIGLATDLFWDGSGGASQESRGVLRPGASRTFVGTPGTPPASLSRAVLGSFTSTLYLYESNGTFRVGDPQFVEYGSGASLGWAPSNVSLFRELSGFTTVSNITNVGGNPVNSVGLLGGNGNARQQFCSVVCSERSVLFNVLGRTSSFSDSATIFYQAGDSNCPSTATFYWTCTMLTVGTNNPSGAAL